MALKKKKEEKVSYKDILEDVLKEMEAGNRDNGGQWSHWIEKIKAQMKDVE
jgi:hypothetical protein